MRRLLPAPGPKPEGVLPGLGPSASRPGPTAVPWPLLVAIAPVTLGVATVAVRLPLALAVGLVMGLVLFLAVVVRAQVGLAVVIVAMLLSPELGAGALGGASGTTASRGVTVRIEDLLLLILGFAWLVHMAVHKDLGLVRRTPLNRAIAAYALVCGVATLWGMAAGRVAPLTGTLYVLKYLEYFVVYFVVANYLSDRGQVRLFTVLLLLTALVVAGVAMAQIPSGQRVSAPFEGERGEPNTLGGYLLFIGALAGGLLLNAPRPGQRWALALLLLILLVPFAATLSRGSYLGLPFVYVTLVVLARRRRASLALVGMVALVLAFAAAPDSVRDRVLYTFAQPTQAARVEIGGVRLDTSTSARLVSWASALRAVGEAPLLGLGITGFGFLDAQYPRTLVETGLVGLACFAVLIGAVWRECLRAWRRAPGNLERGLAMGSLAGLVGLLVHGLGANTFTIVRIMEPFWFVIGMVVSADRLGDPRGPA